jgi:hypothetical protein
MGKIELLVLWFGSILAVVTSSAVSVILSCLASLSVIIAHRKHVSDFIKKIFKNN